MEVIDHVVPLAMGGTNYEGNLVPACWDCNASKSDRFFIVWRHGLSVRFEHLPMPKPLPSKLKPEPKILPERVLLMINCMICGEWTDLPAYYCSDQCRVEKNARIQRDRYRSRHGLPVDKSEPTKSFKSRVLQQVS